MFKKIMICLTLIVLTACSQASSTIVPGAGSVAPAGNTLQPGAVLETPAPDTWSKFGLPGSLIFIIYNSNGNQLVRLDLTTGKMTLIFQTVENAQLNAAWLSPDGKQLVVVYAPPPDNSGNFFFSDLYLLPPDGSGSLKAIIPGPLPDDAYYNPAWAPDGQSLYATHFHRGDGTKDNPDSYSLVKVTLDGKTTPVLKGAIWPVLSPDGSQIAYLSASLDNPQNDLYLTDLQGANPKSLVAPGTFTTEDYHLFSPDGKNLYFSAVNPTALTRPGQNNGSFAKWWDKLFGTEIVAAHNLPSDFYKLSLAGGAPTRLTTIQETGLAGAFSPDGQHLALLTQSNLYVLNPDGSGMLKLLGLTGFGTVQWVK